MATATDDKKTADDSVTKNAPSVESLLKDLRKDFSDCTSSMKDVVKALDNPNVRALGDHAVGYWEGEERVQVDAWFDNEGHGRMIAPPLPKSRNRLPKGYKSNWKSMGGFIADGYRSAKSQSLAAFQNRYEECFKGIKDESILKAVQGMSVQEGQSLGFFVLPEFNMNPLGREYANDLWPRTDRYTVNNNMVFLANAETSRANGSRHGGLRGYWVDEGATLTKSKPTMRRIEISLKKVSILIYLTEELLADGGRGLEAYVRKISDAEFQFMLGDSLINGTGVGMPVGVLNSPALASLTKETGQLAATIVAANLDKMWARRHVSGNYSWYHNQDCGPQLDQLTQAVGTGGVVLYRPQDGIAGQMPMILKSAPRVETEFNATLGTVGDILLADYSQYLTIEKGGVMQAVSTELEFLTDQTAIKLTLRVNGRPWETAPLTPYKGSNTQASFLVVETRS